MVENKQIDYISHIVRGGFPNNGFSKLHFYTKKEDKYYRVNDNTPLSEEDMKKLEDKKQVIKLPRLLEIERGKRKGLWVDSEGKVYIADITNPFSEERLNALEGILLK